MSKIQKMKGTEDLLPGQTDIWQYVEDTARGIFDSYQYKEIRTPLFEAYELFARSAGETSDVVSKEMYDFYDKGERHIALRPEGTAGVVRAYVEHKLFGPEFPKPYKAYYIAPMFRYERPQAGRQRQFHQIGTEVFGSTNPATDAEVIALAYDFFTELGIDNFVIHLNSLGKTAERQAYRQALIDYFTPVKSQLSEDSQRRLTDNPLRLLDSKDARDQQFVKAAPTILDFLGEESREHFDTVQKMLISLNIPFEVNPYVVRGLDYYQDTIFEFIVTDDSIGAQSTICGGGRYDGLVQSLGGPEVPGVGFGIGMERLLLLMQEQQVELPEEEPMDVYVVGLGEATNIVALQLVQAARRDGLIAERDFLNRSLKAQFKAAGKANAKLVMTVGEDELARGIVQVKNSESKEQKEVKLEVLLQDFIGEYRRQTVDTSVIDKYFRGE